MSLRDLLELLLLSLLWGVSFLMMRVAAPEFGAMAMVSARLVMAALCLLPLLLMKNLLVELRQHYKPIIVVGLFNSAFPFCMLAYASMTFTAGYTSIINATTPLWTAIVGMLWMKLHLGKTALLGLLLGFCGVVAMVWGDLGSAQTSSALVAHEGFLLALAAGMAATLSYGSITIFIKKKLHGVNPLTITAGSLLIASVLMLPLGIYFWPSETPSLSAWLAVVVMAVFSTAWGIVLFFRLIRNVGPTKAITVTYLIPAVGMGLGAIFLNEQITEQMLVGCGLILFGVSLATGMIGAKSSTTSSTEQKA